MNVTASPMHPVAPPSKKQRSTRDSGLPKDDLSTRADDAIARRRAELRRLQQMSSKQGPLLQQARSQLGGGGGAPPAVPPPQKHVARARHSDIFPNVVKAPSPATRKPTAQVARRLDPTFEERNTPKTTSRAKSAPPMRPPPPPPPPPVSSESPAKTASPTFTPPTDRRHKLQNLYDLADTPPDIRLVKELKQAQDEKADALRKVERLKKQIDQLQKPASLETLVQVAETSGESAAVSWAREQVSNVQPTSSQVGFLSPMARGTASPIRRMAATPLGGTRKRVATPHPKRRVVQDGDEGEFLTEAAKSIPHEYHSSQATYVVRRPYVKDTSALWDVAGTQSTDAYQTTVNVIKPHTLEVAAKITADASLLTLNGTCTVRHKNANEWRVFDDVDDMDKPLGCVMYIDEDANEKEYWLDAIYEEALAAREAYCSSLLSTAAALQTQKEQGHSAVHRMNGSHGFQETVEKPRPTMADACVGTEGEWKQEMSTSPAAAPLASQPPKTETAKPIPSPTKPAPEEESSSDVLAEFLGMIISWFFGLVWWLVLIPLRIITFGFWLLFAIAFLKVLQLYLADDHGAQMMGAEIPRFNRPGIV